MEMLNVGVLNTKFSPKQNNRADLWTYQHKDATEGTQIDCVCTTQNLARVCNNCRPRDSDMGCKSGNRQPVVAKLRGLLSKKPEQAGRDATRPKLGQDSIRETLKKQDRDGDEEAQVLIDKYRDALGKAWDSERGKPQSLQQRGQDTCDAALRVAAEYFQVKEGRRHRRWRKALDLTLKLEADRRCKAKDLRKLHVEGRKEAHRRAASANQSPLSSDILQQFRNRVRKVQTEWNELSEQLLKSAHSDMGAAATKEVRALKSGSY